MNYTYEENPVLRRDFVLCEPGTENILSDKLNFVMLQLPCLDKDYLNECDFFYEKLLYLLIKMKEGMKTIEQLKQEVYEHDLNEHIKEVFLGVLEDADVASLSPKEREVYDIQLKRYRDNHACLDYAIEKGIRQGIEKGIDKRSKEIAKNMKEEGMDCKFISKMTGLSIEQIENL
jgi:predicted transposase/invertase (TIGR01784 family)